MHRCFPCSCLRHQATFHRCTSSQPQTILGFASIYSFQEPSLSLTTRATCQQATTTMHGHLFLLVAASVLPISASPLPTAANIARDASFYERQAASSLADMIPAFLKRASIIEALPDTVEARQRKGPVGGYKERDVDIEARQRKAPTGGYKERDVGIEARQRKAPTGGYKERDVDIEARQRKAPTGGYKERDVGIEARQRKAPTGGYKERDVDIEARQRKGPVGGY
ncbi:hypothetical protein FB567DRAFT_162619 [Paraphoma chrysanthemicola]|uniref:Uncharacterized protein n=1 Tax=Paraphoma chrysanthemicola TaxID=798071 RepID=A0A8K0W2F5_9PLEO|nr:hypothetical protein FB567DRAFT_162619 [Paraphoma chrysanthemicola]